MQRWHSDESRSIFRVKILQTGSKLRINTNGEAFLGKGLLSRLAPGEKRWEAFISHQPSPKFPMRTRTEPSTFERDWAPRRQIFFARLSTSPFWCNVKRTSCYLHSHVWRPAKKGLSFFLSCSKKFFQWLVGEVVQHKSFSRSKKLYISSLCSLFDPSEILILRSLRLQIVGNWLSPGVAFRDGSFISKKKPLRNFQAILWRFNLVSQILLARMLFVFNKLDCQKLVLWKAWMKGWDEWLAANCRFEDLKKFPGACHRVGASTGGRLWASADCGGRSYLKQQIGPGAQLQCKSRDSRDFFALRPIEFPLILWFPDMNFRGYCDSFCSSTFLIASHGSQGCP